MFWNAQILGQWDRRICTYISLPHKFGQWLVGALRTEQFLFTVEEVIEDWNGPFWILCFSTAKFGPCRKRASRTNPVSMTHEQIAALLARGHHFVGNI